MHIRSLEVQGLADLPRFSCSDLTSSVELMGPSPQSATLAEALSFAFSCFESKALARFLNDLGWVLQPEELEVVAEDFPQQCIWPLPVPDWTTEARRVVVRLELGLDAEHIGELKTSLVREPQLLQAVLALSTLQLSVSGLFSRSFDALAIHLSDFRLGGCEVPNMSTSGVPKWLKHILLQLPSLFYRLPNTPNVPQMALEKMLSQYEYQDYLNFQQAMSPYGDVRVVHDRHHKPVLLVAGHPLEKWGPEVRRQAEVAAALCLTGAQIVWIDGEIKVPKPSAIQLWNTLAEGSIQIDLPKRESALMFKRKN